MSGGDAARAHPARTRADDEEVVVEFGHETLLIAERIWDGIGRGANAFCA
jgi:hypothetical protein